MLPSWSSGTWSRNPGVLGFCFVEPWTTATLTAFSNVAWYTSRESPLIGFLSTGSWDSVCLTARNASLYVLSHENFFAFFICLIIDLCCRPILAWTWTGMSTFLLFVELFSGYADFSLSPRLDICQDLPQSLGWSTWSLEISSPRPRMHIYLD